MLKQFILSQSNLTKGVSSSSLGNNDWGRFLATNLVPILLNFSLVQREKAKLSGGGDHYKGQDLFLWFFFKFGGTSCFIDNKESSL